VSSRTQSTSPRTFYKRRVASAAPRWMSLCAVAVASLVTATTHAQPVSDPFPVDEPHAMNYTGGHSPTTAFDGTNYLAVFDDGGSIFGARLDDAGTPLTIDWLRLRSRDVDNDLSYYYPSAVFGGGKYLVAWAGSELGYRLIGADGSLEATRTIAGDGYYPDVGYDGERFVIAWMSISDSDGRNTEFGFIDLDGNFEHTARLSSSGQTSGLELAVGTNTTLVTWQEHPDTSTSQVWAGRVDRNGDALDPGGFPVADSTGQDNGMQVSASGSNYLVAWSTYGPPRAVNGRLIEEDGSLGAEFALSGPEEATEVVLGFDGSEYAATWTDQTEYPYSFVGRTISVSGTPTSSVAVPAVDPRTSDPGHLLWAKDKYVMAYASNGGLVGQFLDGDLAASGTAFPFSFIPAYQSSPQVVFDGENYVMTWDEQRGIEPLYSSRTTRISQAGQVLEPESIDLSGERDDYARVSIASAGNGSSVAAWTWSDGPIWTQQINADGSRGPLNELVSTAEVGVNIASNGEGYLAAYMRKNTADQYEMVGQLLDETGANAGAPFVMRQTGVFNGGSLKGAGGDYYYYYRDAEQVIQPISAQGQLGEPVVLSSGQSFVDSADGDGRTLLIWRETSDTVLYGRFVDDATFSGRDFVIGTDVYFSRIAWDGTRFAVAWNNEPGQSFIRYVGSDGTLSSSTKLADATSYVYGLASNGAGQLLITSTEYGGPYSYSQRIVNRLVGDRVGSFVELEPITDDPAEPAPDDPATDAIDDVGMGADGGSGSTPTSTDLDAPADDERESDDETNGDVAPDSTDDESDTADAGRNSRPMSSSDAGADAGDDPGGTALEGVQDDSERSSSLFCSLPAAPKSGGAPWSFAAFGLAMLWRRNSSRRRAHRQS